ncbi:MAG TPA: GNAT family N-acetyltransferase [Solirubrobacterales bacterium]
MQIRSARPADVASIDDLVQRAYDPYIERIGRRPAPMDDDYAEKVGQGGVFVAEEADIVGLLVLSHQREHVLIENVAVDPDRQSEGIGRALLALRRTLRERAASRRCGSTPTPR